MVRIRNVEIGVSALLILFGAYIAYGGLGFGYLEDSAPGAGFFPVWTGLGLVLCSGINLVKVVRRSDLMSAIEGAELARVALATLALVGFVWLGGIIGMMPAAFLLMLAIGAIFGPRERRFYLGLVAVSAGMTAALYFIFGVMLAVPLL